MITLTTQPLSREAFAPFGDVIETAGAEHFAINNGSTERYHDLARVQLLGEDAQALISIFRGQPFTTPLTVRMLERHPLGSQAFVPLSNRPYLVVVAEPAPEPVLSTMRAFFAGGHQGVNYHAGVWHHPLLALEEVSDFLVVDRAGNGDNCDEHILPETVTITTP